MITKDYVITMARYNRWQNNCLITVADGFDDATRKKDGGVFFQSIHQTFNHLLWADGIWLSRFTNDGTQHLSLQQSVSLFDQWQALKTARTAMDEKIIAWAKAIDPAWLKKRQRPPQQQGLRTAVNNIADAFF